ncbi:MAG: phosphoglycerate mutase [Candidatus Methanoplasma sp.]|jgi:2,3-bisphosphoglycerate-independent phosphoglycerate mutase|nr:phosphoglycerate mutase [Candidatus Methanoplasma sp.]
MNTLLVLLDGMEDDPNPLLDGMKPYEAAEMPFMRRKAKHKMYTTGRGYTQLFLNEFFTGHPPEISRAVLEALGLGLNISGKRTAYRLSPAEIKDGMIHWSYHAHIFCDRLMSVMNKNLSILEDYDPEIEFFLNGRAVLTMECDDVPDLPAPPVDAPFREVPGDLGKFVMRVAEEMNGITDYPWGCGKPGYQHPPFGCLGERMTAISDSPTALGVAASLGYGISLVNKVEDRFPAAKKALETGNVFLHIDEVDEYSHQKDPRKKIEILEKTDRLMSEYFEDAERIVYFVDHGTSCVTGEHIIMNVPLWTNIDTDISDGELVPLDRIIPRLMGQR